MSIDQNKAIVRKFIDALNHQDVPLLTEVSTPEVAKAWAEWLPEMYNTMRDHHIDITHIIAEGDSVAAKLATRGQHTGLIHGLTPTGKSWTNRVYVFFQLVDGKVCEVDALPDTENIIKQIGGVIVAA